jgi:hypothetical protein
MAGQGWKRTLGSALTTGDCCPEVRAADAPGVARSSAQQKTGTQTPLTQFSAMLVQSLLV